jgi:hypothetical protein
MGAGPEDAAFLDEYMVQTIKSQQDISLGGLFALGGLVFT